MKRTERGQALVLFALVLTALIGIAALVVDIGMKYSYERRYQSLTDAASLAGAQELQAANRTSPITTTMQQEARTEALAIVLKDLINPATTSDPACVPTSNIDCLVAGGRYRVRIKTPSPTCVDCSPERSVQVTVEEPNFSTTFARVLGQTTWDVARTSVAGLDYGKSYTIVTLRPPQPNGSGNTFDVRDFRIEGGSDVVVHKGDVGTNANMEYGGSNSLLTLDAQYKMYYFDPYNGPEWSTPPDPVGQKLAAEIAVPGYVIPGPPAQMGSEAPEGAGSACLAAATSLTASGSKYAPYIPLTGTAPDMGNITCLLPGTFTSDPLPGSKKSDTVILLTDTSDHGLFYFGAGIAFQSSLIGGYTAGAPGVAVVIPQGQELNANTNGSGPHAIALNAGSKFLNSGGAEASAAHDFSGNPIVSTAPATKMTLMVTRDTNCVVTVPPSYPSGCDDTHNDAIKIAGNSDIYLAGIQFMPSDNSSINSSAATGYVGQIWAWTLKYSGGVTINQEGTAVEKAGIIRIDTACSPGVACNP